MFSLGLSVMTIGIKPGGEDQRNRAMSRFKAWPRFQHAAVLIFSIGLPVRAAEPVVNSVGMKLVPVASSEFTTGSDLKPANWDETPLHRVKITEAFLMAETDVTAEQFHRFKPNAPLNAA
jgi:formylglycine-generating enzyme required for sulfatase activity